MKRIVSAAALTAILFATPAAQAESSKDEGSLYLRCDGKPNNTTDGENFARFLGAVTLLGLFAPAPEAPDPKKRLFGAEGVAACDGIIDGDKAEGNVVRRIPLILARAAHRIEALDYEGALVDIAKARNEASQAGLIGNPYFERSMGLAFNRLESVAHLRLGNAEAARDAVLRSGRDQDFATYAMLMIYTVEKYLTDVTPEEERQMAALARLVPTYSMNYSQRLEDVGRFADAARTRRDLLRFFEAVVPETVHSTHYARTAVSEALAGEWDAAAENIRTAERLMESRMRKGKPEKDSSPTVELIDFYNILELVRSGSLPEARRNFAARSRWLAPSFGVVAEVNGKLRESASEDELFGSLEKSPETLWQERKDNQQAIDLEADKDNASLFRMIPSYADIKAFESQSKEVWRTRKSRMLEDEPYLKDTEFYFIHSNTMEPVRNEAMMLHAALQAKAKGKQGFMILTFAPLADGQGVVRFMDRGELGAPNDLFIDADAVIAELSPIIPSPDELKARRRRR